MKKILSLSFVCILTIFLFLVCRTNSTTQKSIYTKEELMSLSSDELFQTFLVHGLHVEDELREIYSDKQIATVFKDDFELMIQGVTGYNNFPRFAKDVQRVYEQLTK